MSTTPNNQNLRMNASRHRVVIYGSREDGYSVTEEELRGLVKVLQSKGFSDAYYLREAPHRVMETLKEMARLLAA